MYVCLTQRKINRKREREWKKILYMFQCVNEVEVERERKKAIVL